MFIFLSVGIERGTANFERRYFCNDIQRCFLNMIAVRKTFSDRNHIEIQAGKLEEENFLTIDCVNNSTVLEIHIIGTIFYPDNISDTQTTGSFQRVIAIPVFVWVWFA